MEEESSQTKGKHHGLPSYRYYPYLEALISLNYIRVTLTLQEKYLTPLWKGSPLA